MQTTRRWRDLRAWSVVVAMAAPGSTIAAGATTTSLVSTANPSHLGQNVFFRATVVGQSPTGTVTFTENAQVLCGGPKTLQADGTALCPVSTLTSGTHQIVASYSGDQSNAPSASDPLSQSVTTLLWTSMVFTSPCMVRTIEPGEPFTYGIRLGGGTSPQGDVEFSDGTNALCTVPLVDRMAACTTTALTASGNEPLTPLVLRAHYLGDGTNAPDDVGSYPATVRNPMVFIFRDDFDYSETCPTQW